MNFNNEEIVHVPKFFYIARTVNMPRKHGVLYLFAKQQLCEKDAEEAYGFKCFICGFWIDAKVHFQTAVRLPQRRSLFLT